MEFSFNPIIDAGVDWITVTCDEKCKRELLEDHSFAWLREEEENGNHVSPWSMCGYNGFHCGGVSFGELNGRWLLRLSSAQAQEHASRAYALSTNCSRIDLQVTIAEVPDAAALIERHYEEASEFFKAWRRPPTVHLWTTNTSTSTLYFNKRISEQFGRVYDKAKESKLDHYKGCVRYEVEFKGALSCLVAAWYFQQPDARYAAVGRVHRFFLERGCSPRFHSNQQAPIRASRTTPDVERQLRWLRAAVRGAVADCTRAGKLSEVLESLGLSELITTNPDGPHGPSTLKEVTACPSTGVRLIKRSSTNSTRMSSI